MIKRRAVLDLAAILACLLSAPSSGCVTTKRAIIEPAPALNKNTRSIFDLPVYRVDIRGYRMYQALDTLAQAVEARSNGQVRFVFQISWLKPREYMRKYGGLAAWPIPDPLNPFVHFQGTNVDLRTIINSLCQQSGWAYDEVITPVGYVFTVRESPGVGRDRNRDGTATQ
jgi:hypothetical protein